jgi:hypothetical protein
LLISTSDYKMLIVSYISDIACHIVDLHIEIAKIKNNNNCSNNNYVIIQYFACIYVLCQYIEYTSKWFVVKIWCVFVHSPTQIQQLRVVSAESRSTILFKANVKFCYGLFSGTTFIVYVLVVAIVCILYNKLKSVECQVVAFYSNNLFLISLTISTNRNAIFS